jgi:hypothetical protein
MDRYNPLFILGNPRSGTSLFRIMLTSHPDICIPPECGFIQWWIKKYRNWGIVDSKSDARVEEFVQDIAVSKKIETWNLNTNELADLILIEQPSSYSEICLCVILQYARQTGKIPKYLGDKNNYYVNHLDLLSEIFPQASYLIISRDGRDVACSYLDVVKLATDSIYKPKLPADMRQIASEWATNNEQLLDFRDRHKKVLFVRFEDLVIQTEQELKRVCTFLNIEFDDSMINYHTRNKELKLEPDQMLDWKKKTLELPDKNTVFRYKHDLGKTEINMFNDIAGSTLAKLGYE